MFNYDRLTDACVLQGNFDPTQIPRDRVPGDQL